MGFSPVFLILLSGLLVYFLKLDKKYNIDIQKEVPPGFPKPRFPAFPNIDYADLLTASLKISLICFLEQLIIIRKLAEKNDYEFSSDMELTALGVSNFIGSFFNCFPVFGYYRRSKKFDFFKVTTQLAGIIAGFFVIFIFIFLNKLLIYIPTVVPVVYTLHGNSKTVLNILTEIKEVKKFNDDFIIYLINIILCLIFGLSTGFAYTLLFSFLNVLKKSAFPHWNFIIPIKQRNDNEMYLENIINNNEVRSFSDYENVSVNNINCKTENIIGLSKEICFCFDFKNCKEKKFHILVINLQGNINFVNVHSLIKQNQFCCSLKKNNEERISRKNENNNNVDIKNKKKKLGSKAFSFGIGAIVFEGINLKTIDFTAYKVINKIVKNLGKNGIIVGFANFNKKIIELFKGEENKKKKIDEEILDYAGKGLRKVLFKIIRGIHLKENNI